MLISRSRTPVKRYITGSLAATTATMITYPLDTAKARLSVSSKLQYSSLKHVFVKTYKEGGIQLLYRGIYPTILGRNSYEKHLSYRFLLITGVIPYAGSSFFTYETLKIMYRDHRGEVVSWEIISIRYYVW